MLDCPKQRKTNRLLVSEDMLVVVQLAFQWRRVLYEEAVLRRAFPEYDDYARRVPRFIPRLGSLRRAFSGA